MSSVVIPNHYLPCVEYIKLCANSSGIIVDVDDNYAKGSYRNRAHIASASGVLRLSIPLEKGKHQQQPIRDVRISYVEDWQRIHWQSICSCYNHSPFFEFYKDGLNEFYKRQIPFLIDWNMELLNWLFAQVRLSINIQFTSSYKEKYDGDIADARNLFSPKIISGNPIIYPQVFENETGFLPNLSSIDMLFNLGGQEMFKKINTLNPLKGTFKN